MTRPLKPADFLILLALVDNERHGYGLLQDISAMTDGEVDLDAGNLYRSLRRLMEDGWIEKAERRPAPESDDERRRYYRLTETGRRIASTEARRMDGLLRAPAVKRLLSES